MEGTPLFRGFVLSYSQESTLLSTRETILQQLGYIVTSVSTRKEFDVLLRQIGAFDLVVLCHTLSKTDLGELESVLNDHTPKPTVYVVQVGEGGIQFVSQVMTLTRTL